MATFYKPFSAHIHDLPVIVYPMLGVEKILENTQSSVQFHLEELFAEHEIDEADYMIVLLWEDNENLMTDVWIFAGLESEEAGYTVDCVTFCELAETHGEGLTASDGLIMLGREAELEENMRKNGKSLTEYLTGPRPELPGELVGVDFQQ
jgi:hypothetical protein